MGYFPNKVIGDKGLLIVWREILQEKNPLDLKVPL